MSFMVERLGPMVEPYFDSLLQYLPKLWTDSDDHHMLRCAIISTLTQIVRVSNFVKLFRLWVLNLFFRSVSPTSLKNVHLPPEKKNSVK